MIRHRRLGALLGASAVLALLAACSSTGPSDAPSAGTGLPKVINLAALTELTGPVTFSAPTLGTDLAVKEVNDSHYLGAGVTLKVKEYDGAFDPQTASQNLSQAIAGGGVTAILGPSISSESLAVAPIAQSAGIPIIYAQSGVSGLLDAGDMQFRVSVPQTTYYGAVIAANMKKKGEKSISIIGTSSNPTYQQLGTQILPDAVKKAGMTVASTYEFEQTATDFQSAISRIVQEKPDAVALTLIGTQDPTAVVQLRQSGYKGAIYASNAVIPKQLVSTGDAGVGVMYPTSFTASADVPSTAKFVTDFKKANGFLPSFFHAEGYDRVWWIARALKSAGSTDGASLAAALKKVGAKGFAGAQGDLTFADGRDARLTSAYLVKWNGSFADNNGEDLVGTYPVKP
jgi:branched-chain amino acid transport system substrate-binding protein